MISFKKFFVVNEAKFRKSKYNTHYKDFPMFSLFYENDLSSRLGISEEELRNTLDTNLPKITEILGNAKNEIGRMGFPSMHANVVLSDLSKIKNPNTGGSVGGIALPSRRYMKLDYKNFMGLNLFSKELVVHEWAHLWMMGNSKAFREAIFQAYRKVFEKVPAEHKYAEVYAKNRIKLQNIIKYFINELTEKPSIRSLLLNEYDDTSDHIKSMIKKKFMYSFESCFYNLGLERKIVEKIKTEELGFVDKLVDTFYESLIKTIQERPSDVKDVLENDDPSTGVFHIFGSWQMENTIVTEIIVKVKEIFLKYSSNVAIYDPTEFARGEEGKWFRDYLRSLINWFSSYGLSNSDEFWATAVEGFFSLPLEHRRMIIKIMMSNS
jgi:hypothetical protein